MGRKTILLIVAAVVAVVGSGAVFLYVKSADDRARSKQELVKVLKATTLIEAGESAEDALAAGKLQTAPVPLEQVVPGAIGQVTDLEGLIAVVTIVPGEQILASKFGPAGSQESLGLPKGMIAISLGLDDPGRVAGFVNPGSDVVIFASCGGVTYTAIDKARVLGVGATTVTSSTVTTGDGEETTTTAEEIPRTLLTVALKQQDAQVVVTASNFCDAVEFGLRNDDSEVRPRLRPSTIEDLARGRRG